MSEIATIITASVALLGALGGAIKWLWVKLEARFTAIEKRGQDCEERSAVQLIVIELMWQEITRLAPDGSLVLERAQRLLDKLKKESV